MHETLSLETLKKDEQVPGGFRVYQCSSKLRFFPYWECDATDCAALMPVTESQLMCSSLLHDDNGLLYRMRGSHGIIIEGKHIWRPVGGERASPRSMRYPHEQITHSKAAASRHALNALSAVHLTNKPDAR